MSAVAPIKSPEEVKKVLDGKTHNVEKELQEAEDPKMQREWEFTFRHEDGQGRVFQGVFVNKIANFMDLSKIGAVKANFLGGLPIESFDTYTLDHNEKMAHLSVSLIKRPDWCQGDKLFDLYDKGLLDALYAEVASHEATFHGRKKDQTSGKVGGEDAKGATEVVVEPKV